MKQFIFLLLLTITFTAQAQDTRGIVPLEFVKARPTKTQTPVTVNRRTIYRRTSTKSVAETKSEEFAQLGLTIWRLRPAKPNDAGLRIIAHKENETNEFIPERLPANAPMHIGENIRLSFESPQTGYLYVIDREQYADGSFGEPVLIFPTTRTRNGDNQVAAGKLIEIPAQEDRPNYFTLLQSQLKNSKQIGEVLTVIVAPKPLEGITIRATPLTLTNEQIQQWEKQWGAQTETFDLAGDAGKGWTKAEQEAGASGTRQLTQQDPEPQTIYRVAIKSGVPLLVKVGLRYGNNSVRKMKR